jgi:GntR family transcriptional repressor for pyruvate dehydrogenase complex
MGIIEMKQGSGTYVRSVTPSSFMESLSPALMMNKSSAMELLDARLYIEGAVASLAARKATREDIQGLRSLLEDMKKNLEEGNIKGFISNDVQFHMMIAESSKNRVLVKVVETIRDALYEFIAKFFSIKPETVKDALEFHTKIFVAIESRNHQEAKKQMESHIRSLIRMIHKSDLMMQLKSGNVV